MAIIAREPDSKFPPAPEGLQQGVCVDVVDLGLKTTPWGDKPKVLIVWELDVFEESGRPFQVRKSYTLSLSEKANLRRDLECWRGKKFTAEELKGFDLEKLLLANCQLQIVHVIRDDGQVYANVQAIVPFNPKYGAKLSPSKEFVRAKDRPRQQGTASPASSAPTVAEEEEDAVPF